MRIDRRLEKKQRGGTLLAMALVLAVIGTIWAANRLLELAAEKAKRAGTSQNVQQALIQQALSAYVSQNKRLPCPANGFLDSSSSEWGKELRDAAGNCDSTDTSISDQRSGVVPWVTLGLRKDDVLSEDLTFYSYRVFSGPTGLTQAGGADMTHCDVTNSPKPDASLDPNGLCKVDHSNSIAQFLSGKGLTVQKDGVPVSSQVAYVLIHHGANEKGAFLPTGIRKDIPATTNVAEYANTQGTDNTTYKATYYANTPNVAVGSDDDSYFDDRTSYVLIEDLIKQAGLSSREWPEELVDASSTMNMTSPSTDPNSPHFVSTGSDVLSTSFLASTTAGVTTVTFGAASGSYAGCLWWPNSISMTDGSTRYRWTIYTEYSLADYFRDEAPGFTFGFISSSAGGPGNTTCGGLYTGRLGWADGTLSSLYNGKRFAVEIDTRRNDGFPYDANDPSEVHMAIDRDGTIHDNISASSCASSGYGMGCHLAGNSTFLSEDGLFAYHSLRIELTRGCSLSTETTATSNEGSTTITVLDITDIELGMSVSGVGIASGTTVTGLDVGTKVVSLSKQTTGDIPIASSVEFQSDSRTMLKAWTLSRDGCQASPELCIAIKSLTKSFSNDLNGNSEALHVKQCLPSSITGLEDLYFGFTTANYQTSGTAGPNFSFRTLQTARHIAN